MHKDLIIAFNKLVNILKEDKRCKGGWHFGSVSRGLEDIYSDYDPVFIVSNDDFENFANDLEKYFNEISDELILFWAENFNDNYFKNYCSIIRIGEYLHQLDIFIINYDYPETWMCKLHSKGCTKKDIIFDRIGEVSAFLDKGYSIDNNLPDTKRAIDTYWFHTVMLIKYFKRNDIFKLIKNIDILFHAHKDLLLSYYDKLDWGSWESKIKYCVPNEKQENLKLYFNSADINIMKKSIIKCIKQFENDAKEICIIKNIKYSEQISQKIMKFIINKINIYN
jgi:predicted nucleotidyltransferase